MQRTEMNNSSFRYICTTEVVKPDIDTSNKSSNSYQHKTQ